MPSKAERTRAHLLDVARRLFIEDGYESATMRRIAQAAGVSVGNAYYHFQSKEHLVLALYQSIQHEHDAILPEAQARVGLAARLGVYLHAVLHALDPYKAFISRIFAVAADPDSPLSPFGDASVDIRAQSIARYAALLEGISLAPALQNRAPTLLWMLHMGIILRYIHDRSENATQTHALIDQVVPLVVQLLQLFSSPLGETLLPQIESILDALPTPQENPNDAV